MHEKPKGFKNMEQVKEACIKVNSIENIADDFYPILW
jgi:hypothetical protein